MPRKRKARRRNLSDAGATALTIGGVFLGLAVLGATVYAIRSPRNVPALGGVSQYPAPVYMTTQPTWYSWKGWPWMWFVPPR